MAKNERKLTPAEQKRKEHFALLRLHIPELRFEFRRNGEHLGALRSGDLLHLFIMQVLLDAARKILFAHVAGVNHRL